MKSWEDEIRECEAAACRAFLAADETALNRLWADGYLVNSPMQRVLKKAEVVQFLGAGRIRHTAYEFEIEHIVRHGDVVVVMGNDRVSDPPDGRITRRRFTNIWQQQSGEWRAIARHANAIAEAARP